MTNVNTLGIALNINTTRDYTTQSSPAFSTVYTPNANMDTFVTAIVQIVANVGQSGTINAQVNAGGGMVTRATISFSNSLSVLGLTGSVTDLDTITFWVPANATFQLISSGSATNTISSINYMNM